MPLLALSALSPAHADPAHGKLNAGTSLGAPAILDVASWLGGIFGVLRRDSLEGSVLDAVADSSRSVSYYDHIAVPNERQMMLGWATDRDHAWILEQRFVVSERVVLTAEWLEITTEEPAWAKLDLEPGTADKTLLFSVQVGFGNKY